MRRAVISIILTSLVLAGCQSLRESSLSPSESAALKAYEEALVEAQQSHEEALARSREAYEESLACALDSFIETLAAITDDYKSAIASEVVTRPVGGIPGPTAEELAAQKAYEEAVAKADALARAASASRSSGSATTTKKFGTGTPTFRGAEMGNALSTTFGASQGTVGRNLYVPIYYYMPLPERVSDSVYQRIGTKSTFETLYQKSGSTWTLKSSVPLPSRGDYWRMLEDAGLDPAKADYKTGKK